MTTADRPLVSLSAIEHHRYCKRQCALIHVDGIWIDNRFTVKGNRVHSRVDSGEAKTERGRSVLRSIPLWSNRWGLTGRADAVDVFDDGTVAPVEYKSGVRHGDTAHLQLCAQALCLEEMLSTDVPTGYLWYDGTRRRVAVAIDDELRAATVDVIEQIRASFSAARLPPAHHDERCQHCQFEPVCVPELVEQDQVGLRRLVEDEVYRCD